MFDEYYLLNRYMAAFRADDEAAISLVLAQANVLSTQSDTDELTAARHLAEGQIHCAVCDWCKYIILDGDPHSPCDAKLDLRAYCGVEDHDRCVYGPYEGHYFEAYVLRFPARQQS